MKCPNCNCNESKVLETRTNDDEFAIRRRRECTACGKRFTTFETIETNTILVVKSNGNRELFNEFKLRTGIIKACEKRPIAITQIDKLVSEIKKQLSNSLLQEVSSKELGELVMQGLKEIDEIAYIRFASVYRQFKDMTTFLKEIEKLISEK